MLLVVDANILFSSLITGGRTFEIFLLNRRLKKFKFVAPEYLMVEVKEHMDEIVGKTRLKTDELEKVLGFIEREIEFIPFEEFKELHEKAEQVSPDPDDVPYFALALKLGCAIWSNDKPLKKQAEVRMFSTEDILKMVEGCR